jgi:23S rRNA (cytosine1962-C5)-methyltransferase
MIRLKKNAHRRVRNGHLWVFSNEISDPPVNALEAGSIHELWDHAGDFIGMCYANPASLITARILSRKRIDIDRWFFSTRIETALAWRSRLFPDRDFYRVVFGEADYLPGLIVDRYRGLLVIQTLTAGMDRHRELIVEALVDLMAPTGIFRRNDSPARILEGLPQEKGLEYGSVPSTVEINSNGLRFLVDISEGQKTGFFLDQESNRSLIQQYAGPGTTVLDLFAYTGAWGLHALAGGAERVTAVDSSRGALRIAAQNAELNGMSDRFDAVRDNAVDFLKKCRDNWDLIVLDPPAFIKSRATVREGRKGYIDINRRALGRLRSGGILITCSCSHHLRAEEFEQLLATASRQSGRELRILDFRGQAPDHPVLLSMPETRYLKVIVAQVA